MLSVAQQGSPQPASLVEKAKLYMSLSMFDNARQSLTAAWAQNELDPVAHFLMGELWFVDKEWLQLASEVGPEFETSS